MAPWPLPFAGLAVLFLSLVQTVRSYSDPEGCSGDCFTHDPSLVQRHDGTYFRFSTLDRIGIWTAEDLSGPWNRSGSVLPNGSVIDLPGNKELWAPDVSYYRGAYYLFYAVSTPGSQTSAIGYATSPTLEEGSWTDHGALITSNASTPYNAIDPNVVNGTAADEFFLTWGSYWGDIYQARATVDGSRILTSADERQIAYNPADQHQMEGAFVYRRDGWYYLFISVGDCCHYDPRPPSGHEYRITVCRSPSPGGPFVDRAGVSCTEGGGTTVLASHGDVYAPGGQGVFHDGAYGDVLYYHYLNNTIGVDYSQSQFGWNVIAWDEDGWPVV
ncbi:hypothetical protein VTK73DRAFT_8291 [Phialemonium thermophilum]|uniref:Arabinan endo-1,5-alpha-L-arabinosidase n=1 Tax=Phialemonium thermophilum TaxID=223376 RepID=A0ABR3W9B4_9PEZI